MAMRSISVLQRYLIIEHSADFVVKIDGVEVSLRKGRYQVDALKIKTLEIDEAVSVQQSPVDINLVNASGLEVAGPLTDSQLRAGPVAVSGPLTDAQLRAAALAVTGPLTDAQLRAGALAVTGPLTDAQLRASPIQVAAGKPIESYLWAGNFGAGIYATLYAYDFMAAGTFWKLKHVYVRCGTVAQTVDVTINVRPANPASCLLMRVMNPGSGVANWSEEYDLTVVKNDSTGLCMSLTAGAVAPASDTVFHVLFERYA